jgi:hypothetical protein
MQVNIGTLRAIRRRKAPATRERNDFIDEVFWKACVKETDCSEFS